MATCIFCDTELTAATKPEHILLNALGGRKTTRQAICSEHNNAFGGSIDKAITDQIASFRNLLQLQSGARKPPATMRVENTQGERLVLRPDGPPKLVQKPFTVTPRPEGGFDVQINARDGDELASLIPHIAAATGVPVEQVWDQLIERGKGAWTSRRAGTIHQQLSLGGEESLRSICKAALCLIAASEGAAPLKGEPFAAARAFVLDGGEIFNRERGTLDPRLLPAASDYERRFGPLFNLIQVRSNREGRVVAHFTLYNLVAWQAVLAECGGPADLNLALASNPLDPGCWSDRIAAEIDTPFAWLDAPDRTGVLEASTARISNALALWRDRGVSQLASQIVNDVFDRHREVENETGGEAVLTGEVIDEITNELAHHIVGVPLERPMTAKDLARMRDRSKAKGGRRRGEP